MNKEEIAEALDGVEYPVSKEVDLFEAAKKNRLVIVFGASDDLIEFRGAIYDEAYVWDGGEVKVDKKGLLAPLPETLQLDEVEEMAKLIKRYETAHIIKALWAKEGDYSWTYETDIPHATFEVVENASPYCRGIIFSLDDL